jgi:nucleolar protein 56
VPDNYLYARVALIVKDKGTLSEEKLPELTEVLGEEAKAQEVRQQQQQQQQQQLSAAVLRLEGASCVQTLSTNKIALHTLLMVVQWQWYGQSVILLH